MKTILSILLLVCTASLGFTQNNSPSAPIMKFTQTTHDFGNIKEGPKGVYDFEFTNVGKEPLLIQNCTASCGCTIPTWTKEPILPGQKGKITVTYNTQGRVGTFSKTIYIASNAKSEKERFELYIKGNVVEDHGQENASSETKH